MTCKETMELILSIFTLLLSIIAIAISICTSRKQTKVQLFDKRYDVFCILSFLVAVAEQTIENKDISEQELLLTSKNAYLEAISPIEQKYNNSDLKAFYHNLCLSARKVSILFPKKYTNVWRPFIKTFTKYFTAAIDYEDTEATKKELNTLLNIIHNDKTLNSLEKHLSIR